MTHGHAENFQMMPADLRIFCLVPALMLLLAGCARPGLFDVPQPQGQPVRLLVQVDNIQQPSGFVAIAVYHHPELFTTQPWDVALAAIVDGTAVRPFELPPGDYAVLAFQDVNSNGKLDRYWFGLPKEPFTHSGEKSRFGPPDWQQARFTLPSSGLTLQLSMPDA